MSNFPISDEVQALIVETSKVLVVRLAEAFQREPMVKALGVVRAKQAVLHAKAGPAALPLIAALMRDAYCDGGCETRGLTFSLWDVVDAISFVGDCTNPAWRYMDDGARKRSLGWALDHLKTLEAGLAVAEANALVGVHA